MITLTLERITKDHSNYGLHKYELYFEDYKQDLNIMRKVTRADRAWNWAYSARNRVLSALRVIHRKVGQQ